MPQIGGMHWIMGFLGTVGVLMKNSGLVTWLKKAFRGTEKSNNGEKFLINITVLPCAMLKLLRSYAYHLQCLDGLT